MVIHPNDYIYEPQGVDEPCLVCEHKGIKVEKVFFHGVGSTLVGYGGHDDNCKTGSYTCSNGHFYGIRYRNVCKCGWKGKTDCFCSILGVTEIDPMSRQVVNTIPIEIEREVEHPKEYEVKTYTSDSIIDVMGKPYVTKKIERVN
jgi:hypothetical protein